MFPLSAPIIERQLNCNSLAPLEEAGFALIQLIDGRRGGEQRVVGGVEGGGAAVALLHWQRAGSILQRLRREGGRGGISGGGAGCELLNSAAETVSSGLWLKQRTAGEWITRPLESTADHDALLCQEHRQSAAFTRPSVVRLALLRETVQFLVNKDR